MVKIQKYGHSYNNIWFGLPFFESIYFKINLNYINFAPHIILKFL